MNSELFIRSIRLKEILQTSIRRNPSAPIHVRAHLASIFKVDSSNDRILQSRAREVRRLVREVQREVKTLENIDHALYLEWVPRAIEMFTVPNLDYHWEQGRTQIDSNDLVRLDFCIDALKSHYDEGVIDESQLAKIRTSVESLKADVLKAGFDDDLREAIGDALQALLIAIDEYSLREVRRLEEGLAVAVGTVIVKFGQLREPGALEKWSRLKDRYGTVVGDIFSAISAVVKHKDALIDGWNAVKKLLPGAHE